MKATLHHFAYNIKPNSLELIIELFKIFNCTISYRRKNERWCMIEQKHIPIDIQIIETKDKEIPLEKKINTHIAFLSETPKNDIYEIEQWCKNKNLKFKQGQWSEKELWFDLPDIFTNFVIELMHTSVVK